MDFEPRLKELAPALGSLRRGVEKESLRVNADGTLALTPHPPGLGSALTHPRITTDFSESQLELITGVHAGAEACVDELRELHQFVFREIGDELLWGSSMPCALPGEDTIPFAQYGSSNVGRAKTVYRTGLSHRYGRRMQMISGVHYNFSLPEEAWSHAGLGNPNEGYFALIRNFRRHAWLLLYLFGASPAVCASFVAGREHALRELSRDTLYLPHATSLRMGRLGYLSQVQDALCVSYNDLESYAASLTDALTHPYPAYEAIGIRDGDNYRQLATTLLQIENEFYSMIRPKRVIRAGERPLHALRERGVQYVEVRAMDLDPFAPVGLAVSTARFLDVFLLHCLLAESPKDTADEIRAKSTNSHRVASRGRETGLTLVRNGSETPLRDWGVELVDACASIAEALDAAGDSHGHAEALASARSGLDDPERLPSARVVNEIVERHGGSYVRFVLHHSRAHRQALLERPLASETEARMKALAQTSRERQRTIEASDTVPFETYRQRYLAPTSLVVESPARGLAR